jgi:hypothetical protein
MIDNRTVEIFWGARKFEIETKGMTSKALSEHGATLLFARDDNGYVIISLFPAYTENRKPIESSITLKIWLDPAKLKDKRFLWKCWNDFIAYMEYTSLDGKPSGFQKLRISYLRNFKYLIVENKWTPTKFSTFSKKILEYVFTVGLSGFIFYIVAIGNQPKESKIEEQLIKLNRSVEGLSIQIDKMLYNTAKIKDISKTTDSIRIRAAEIVKALKK